MEPLIDWSIGHLTNLSMGQSIDWPTEESINWLIE